MNKSFFVLPFIYEFIMEEIKRLEKGPKEDTDPYFLDTKTKILSNKKNTGEIADGERR